MPDEDSKASKNSFIKHVLVGLMGGLFVAVGSLLLSYIPPYTPIDYFNILLFSICIFLLAVVSYFFKQK